MRQQPTRSFPNQPIPACSGFTCMGCLKIPRGPSGTCHSKAKVPRDSIPLTAATSKIRAHIRRNNLCWFFESFHGVFCLFFRGLLCCLSWGLGFICSFNKTGKISGMSYHTLQSPGNVQDGASAELNSWRRF